MQWLRVHDALLPKMRSPVAGKREVLPQMRNPSRNLGAPAWCSAHAAAQKTSFNGDRYLDCCRGCSRGCGCRHLRHRHVHPNGSHPNQPCKPNQRKQLHLPSAEWIEQIYIERRGSGSSGAPLLLALALAPQRLLNPRFQSRL